MNTVQELAKALDEYHSSGFEAGYEKGFKAGREEAIRNGVVHREWKKYRRVKEGAEYYGFGMRTFRVMAEDINHSMTFFRRGKKTPYTYEFKFGPTKSAAGNRIIPMTDDAYKVLSELKEKRIRYGAHGLVVDGARDFIFVRDGNLYKHTAIDHKLKVIVDSYNQQELHEAKIEGRVPLVLPYCSCHSFRHTFCTRLCEQESNIKAIQEIMGHADITTTMNIYAEATEGKKLEVMDNFSKRFEGDD